MKHASDIKSFIRHHYRHYNAAALVDAAEGYVQFLDKGGKMFLAMAGAMSTAELGLSLADMIREGKIHGISCTPTWRRMSTTWSPMTTMCASPTGATSRRRMNTNC